MNTIKAYLHQLKLYLCLHQYSPTNTGENMSFLAEVINLSILGVIEARESRQQLAHYFKKFTCLIFKQVNHFNC